MAMQSIIESLQSYIVGSNALFTSSYSYYAHLSPLQSNDRKLWGWGLSSDDGYVFDDYVPTTIDTGWTLFIIAAIISVVSILILPLNVKIGKYVERKIAEFKAESKRNQQQHDTLSSNNHNNSQSEQLAIQPYTNLTPPPPRRTICQYLHSLHSRFFLHISTYLLHRWGKTNKKRRHGQRERNARARERERATTPQLRIVAQEANGIVQGSSGSGESEEEGIELSVRRQGTGITSVTAATARTVESSGGQMQVYNGPKEKDAVSSIMCTRKIQRMRKLIVSILKYDDESRRLMKLAVPFTLTSILYSVTDMIQLGIISQYLGTEAMIAYAIIDLTVGTTSSLLGGFISALTTLASIAYGAGNYHAVGQYVQLGTVTYTLAQIPFIFVWGYFMEDIVLLFGFNEEAAALAARFVWVVLPEDLSEGVQYVLMELLEVTGHEVYASVFYCVGAVADVILSWVALAYFDADLIFLGLVYLGSSLFFTLLNVMISVKCGWLDKFEDGMIRSNAFRNNRTMLKEFFKTSIPLSIGSLLSYAEWELLTGFAAVLGPAEAATWAILGYAWDVFESTTSSFADAGEVRVAHLLGKGCPQMAKLSAYKSVFMGLIMSMTMSTIFISMINILPQFLSVDEVIQNMLRMLFPMIALSNVAMNTGMTCWSLVGAQLRYPLATTIATLCSFGITLPLGAIFTIVLNYDLKGLTFAVIIGYVMTGMLMTTVLLMSDWEKLSQHIRATVGAEESIAPESESESSSSSDEDEESGPQDKDTPLATVIMTADWGKHSVRHKPIAEDSGDGEEFRKKQNKSLPLAQKDIIGRRGKKTKAIKRGHTNGDSALKSKSSSRQSSQETEASSDTEPRQETLEDPAAPVQMEGRVHTFSDLAADSSHSRRDFDAKIIEGGKTMEEDPNVAPSNGILNSFVTTWWE